MHLTAVVAIAAASLAVTWVVARIRDHFYHAARARELGCQLPPPARFYADPSGLVGLLLGVRASQQKRFVDFITDNFAEMERRHGRPVGTVRMRRPFFRDSIFTLDPQNIQTVLALKFKDFELGVNRTDNFKPLLGNGIFAANGKQWEHSRALLRPQFVRSQVSDLDLEERHVQALMAVLERRLGAGGWTDLVDLQALFFRLTLDSATEFLFGESVDSQLGGGKASFAHAFDSSQHTLAIGARMGHHYWLVHTPGFHRMVRSVNDFVDYFVQKAMSAGAKGGGGEKGPLDGEKGPGGEKGPPGKYVFLDALARETQDPAELRSQLLNILLAGRDTTASTLAWFFFTMADARYEPVFRRLRAAVLDDFGTYAHPRDITFQRMKACQYLQWCINECLRLYPVVSVNVRTAVVDTSLPTGGGPDGRSPVYVKKGHDVGYSVHVMQRRKDLWGADADVFRPERWEHRRPGWDYLPFNGGPRICIGQQFALTEVAYVIVRLVQRIDALDGSRAGPVRHGLTLTNCPGDGVNVRVHFGE